MPRMAVKGFEKIVVPFLRVNALSEAERRLFQWSDRYSRTRRGRSWRPVTPVMVATAYRDALAGGQRPKTLQQIAWTIDLMLHGAHVGAIEHHKTPTVLPDWQVKMPVAPGGVMAVRDVARPEHTCGVSSFIERSPIELVTYAAAVHRVYGGTTDEGLRVWDITAGSGTVTDVMRFFNAVTIATDLNFGNLVTRSMDCRQIGQPPFHARIKVQMPPAFMPQKGIFNFPDLIFFDPPSRGQPAVSGLYFGADDPRDLSLLSRDEYIATIVGIVQIAVARLRAGGLVSFTIRGGVRNHQHVVPDPGLADDILGQLGDDVLVFDRLNVLYAEPVKQISLGTARVPTTHVFLARNDG